MRALLIVVIAFAVCGDGTPTEPSTAFCEMFGDCATARLTFPDGIPRDHCAFNPAFDHDGNGLHVRTGS